MIKYSFLFLLSLAAGLKMTAQDNRLTQKPTSSAAIYHQIEKLGFLGTALIVAAHPDDENTRLISWLANDRNAQTAYLSVTRGDGGQNLIGPQLREQLGLIRTQELLEARNIDGGEQFFTRANDFGYSKHPDETLEIWNKQEVLEDMVRIIRTFKPDVIINRFDHRSPGTTHGHHTSSAMLSMTAYEIAGLKSAYGQQLATLEPWQAARIFFNTSWWFYGSEDAFAKADKTNLIQLDAGTYFPWSGYSNGEVAAQSRSRHQSQGFGSSGSRGEQTEYLEFLDGSFPTNKDDVFSGINTTWTRVKGGAAVEKQWQKICASYDFKNPEASLEELITMRKLINNLKDAHWKKIKLAAIDYIILQVAGVYIELSASEPHATPGEVYNLNLELTNRSSKNIQFSIQGNNVLKPTETSHDIAGNKSIDTKMILQVPQGYESSTPYWLQQPGTTGMYTVNDKNYITLPESQPAFNTRVAVTIGTATIVKTVPLLFKRTDPVRGEVREPFYVVPALSLAITNPVYIFNNNPQEVQVTVTPFMDIANAALVLRHPKSWTVAPANQSLKNLKKGISQQVAFTVTAPKTASQGSIHAQATVGQLSYSQQIISLEYNHIPNQQYVIDATATVVKPVLINDAKRVAYITGAGDEVALAIEAIGTTVDQFVPANLPMDLSVYNAVVIGIRAANVHDDLPVAQTRLANYVNNGGTLIMQYNTAGRFDKDALGPLDITLSRKRVTNENAVVTFLAPNHKILNAPNKITQDDFKNWVQERGLYFPDKWDASFEPILGMHDDDEEMTTGSLIVAPYGKGHVIYTGLSLFRELPAGVPGAYRLLANMLNISN